MKILVVEDEEKLAQILKKSFVEEGWNCRTLSRGEEALEVAGKEPWDLLVLDLGLPGISGLDVIQGLRARGLGIPVIVLTAKDGVADKVAGLDAGADDYLTKPFALEELLARVRVHQRKNDTAGVSVIRCGELTLDWKTRRVQRSGRDLDLSTTEFALLELLVRHRGRALTRTDIGQEVWGKGFDTGTNYIDVHINRLRKKVDKDFPTPLIHTIRGEGYALKE